MRPRPVAAVLLSEWPDRTPAMFAPRLMLLTRQPFRSHSRHQEWSESRRRSPARVVSLARARTQSRAIPAAPNLLNQNDRPRCAWQWTALAKLAVEPLQRRSAALPSSGAARLNAI